MKNKYKYLNDGIYVRWDGFSIIISVNRTWNEVVSMEPVAFEKLVAYYASIDAISFVNPFPERHRQSRLEALKELIEGAGNMENEDPELEP